MMHHQAGVKTVVVGGKPSYGPMQAPAGTRGARSYTLGHLNQDINITKRLNNNTAILLPARELDYWISYASVNLRDQIREDQAGIPLQFVYEAADCRIFYTKDTYNNYSNLWQYAADAIWSDPPKCVKGSAGHATYGKNTDRIGPPQPPQSTNTMYGIPTATQSAGPQNAIPVSLQGGLTDGSRSVLDYQGRKCKRFRHHPHHPSNCPPSYDYIKAKRCTRHGKRLHESQCWPKCWSNGNCEQDLCQPLEYSESLETWIGTCPPKPPPLHCVEPRQNDLLIDYHPEPQKV